MADPEFHNYQLRPHYLYSEGYYLQLISFWIILCNSHLRLFKLRFRKLFYHLRRTPCLDIPDSGFEF